ncbi:MAG TPA: NosD domain-containing protein [Polyangia bacterium]|nr:NosD domain-containing protein [Polyangia bacterium]
MVAVVWAAAGCTKTNPNYCADAGLENGYACSKLDAGHDAPTVVDATDAKDATDVSEGGDVRSDAAHDATEAPAERPTCSNLSCTTAEDPICDVDAGTCGPCTTNDECTKKNPQLPACEQGECYACTMDAQCTKATMPICDAHACRSCDTNADCASKTATPACASSGACVQCVGNSDCTGTKPICNTTANTCRSCQTDAECPANPGVCMTDGHCAGTGEVIFIEFNAGGCAGADGSSAKPYCAPNDGVAQLTAGRRVIVVRGAAGDRMSLSTAGILPIVIGRKSASNVDGSIPATASTSLTISSDTVLVRDLVVNLGSMSTSKGIAIAGASTKVSLIRVTASLGTGLGIDAESGSSLTMDESYVLNNSSGGILISGASYSIQNSVIAGNGYGIQFSSAIATNAQLRFNTIASNTIAASCDLTNSETFTDSIFVGPMVNCNITNSVTAMLPTFSTTRPYHLTAHIGCPTAPAAGTFPDHDVDGDARTGTIDCGADQFQ